MATSLTSLLAQARGTAQPVQDTPVPTQPKASRVLTSEQMLMVEQLREARELARIAKAHEENAKTALFEALGDAVLGTDGNGKPVVQVNAGSRTGVDTDLLQQGFPEAYEATRKTTQYKGLKVL